MKQYIASALFQLKEATKYTQAGSSDNNSFSGHFSATISSHLLQETTRRAISWDGKVEKGLGLQKGSEVSG